MIITLLKYDNIILCVGLQMQDLKHCYMTISLNDTYLKAWPYEVHVTCKNVTFVLTTMVHV